MANWEKAKETSFELRKLNVLDSKEFSDDLAVMLHLADSLAEEASDDFYVSYAARDMARDIDRIMMLAIHLRDAKQDLFTYISSGAYRASEDEDYGRQRTANVGKTAATSETACRAL